MTDATCRHKDSQDKISCLKLESSEGDQYQDRMQFHYG